MTADDGSLVLGGELGEFLRVADDGTALPRRIPVPRTWQSECFAAQMAAAPGGAPAIHLRRSSTAPSSLALVATGSGQRKDAGRILETAGSTSDLIGKSTVCLQSGEIYAIASLREIDLQ